MPSYLIVLILNLISLPPMLSLLSSANFISEFFLAVVNSTASVFSTKRNYRGKKNYEGDKENDKET